MFNPGSLSTPNRRRLERVCGSETQYSRGSPESRAGARRITASDAAQQLSSAKDDESRHEALLLLFTALSQLPDSTKSCADKGNGKDLGLVQIIIEAALTPTRTEDHVTHALIAEIGLATLELLSRSAPSLFSEEALIAVLAYTDARDPWTSEPASQGAALLVWQLLPQEKLGNFIVGRLIQDYIRPTLLGPCGQSGDDNAQSGRTAKPSLESTRRRSITIFRWAVDNADSRIMGHHWHLFLPILLDLMEDPESSVREAGLEILVAFLRMCPSQTLLATGMSGIFENAVFPLLLPISNTCDLERSLSTLRLAYDAIILLGQTCQSSHSYDQRRLLDRLTRDGILTGYFHASQNVAVVEILMHYVKAIVNSLGIYAVKHLKVLLDIIESVMTDPFAATCPSMIVAAGHALNAILCNCWSRIQVKREDQVLRIIAICWVNACDHRQLGETTQMTAGAVTAGVREVLLTTSKLLQSLGRDRQPAFRHRLTELASRESQLTPLLQPHLSC
ncbi:hypothetical protein HIM_09150 [Hirsutella minnesotensis 3608]|uniref:Uncharacterized protein n=1 Tax=Hirsutella minnesotensis 3608 TaxID=1043627 RepID=A0A0F8A3A0_9HYPO|nr:hypothetical protein HIM_09150 [Hirsutella minnesotensis 3608]